MGKKTKITWANSTFNGWIGCEHAMMPDGTPNELCIFCYAERENEHWRWNGGSWGPGQPRKITSLANWNQPFKWDQEAAGSGQPWRVFAFSLGDIFDESAPIWPADRPLPGQGQPLLKEGVSATEIFINQVVKRTPNLTWLLLSKRYDRAAEQLMYFWPDGVPANIWPIFSAGNQATLELAAQALRRIQAPIRGISAEPLLGPMDFTPYWDCIDWVIVGGESGPKEKVRLMQIKWELSIRTQCKTAGRAYFLKQLGTHLAEAMMCLGVGADPEKWPLPMRVQQFPVARG